MISKHQVLAWTLKSVQAVGDGYPMTNSISAQEKHAPDANAATPGSSSGIMQKIASFFSPGESNSDTNEPPVFPSKDYHTVKIHFNYMSAVFELTQECCEKLFKGLEDPYCKYIMLQGWWVNKDNICGVQVMYEDDKSVPANPDGQRSEQSRPLDKEKQEASSATASRGLHPTATAPNNQAPCPRMYVPRGTAFTR